MQEVSVGQTSGAAQRCSTLVSTRELVIRDPHALDAGVSVIATRMSLSIAIIRSYG
jgi:hypothetical protein